MDDPTATIVAALIGAAAAVVLGLVGALAAVLPAWGLEKRQSQKEARDEVRRLLTVLVQELLDFSVYFNKWANEFRGERGVHLVALSSQLGFVLRPKDAPVLEYVRAVVGVIVLRDGHGMESQVRMALAVTAAEGLPEWYRDEKTAKSFKEQTKSLIELTASIRQLRNSQVPGEAE